MSAPRPKRPAEDFLLHQNPTQTSKKPRFDARNPSTLAPDAPEEDLILDADVIGKRGAGRGVKRNAVNIDGYDSDSDNDNFDVRAAERGKEKQGAVGAKGSKDEEEDDMFADLEVANQGGTGSGDDDEEMAREGKKRKKDVRFMDQRDIEGQVMNSRSGGHVPADLLLDPKSKRRAPIIAEQEDDSSSSGSDSERDAPPEDLDEETANELGAGSKKRHAPRLDAFNLKDEEEEGRYDEAGNYVRKGTDPDAENDSWLEGLSKKDMKRAREAQEKRDGELRRKAGEDDALLTSDLLSTLIAHLATGETPLEALQRLNKGKRAETKVPKWKQKKQQVHSQRMDLDNPHPNGNDSHTSSASAAETTRKATVEAITGASDALYSRSQHEIYSTERESLMRQYKRETGDDWNPTKASASAAMDENDANGQAGDEMWEYRWSDARDGREQHGPYDGKTMEAWNAAGYFGEGVEFRRVDGSEWSRVLDVR